jgi:AcrR family transcriptional regulator
MSQIKRESSPLHVCPQPALKIGKSDRTRAAILNAALDFVWSRPFREMTVAGLMSTTGASRSTFYQYFSDLHEVMETLLTMLEEEILTVDEPWLVGVGDPVTLLRQTLADLVDLCYERGPFLRAITDDAATDPRLEKAWAQFLANFDDAGTARIEADQKQGLIPNFEARPVIFALNRLDAYTVLQAFGQHPRQQPEPVREALGRIWISTLYGSEWLGKESSDLVRT